VILLGAAVNADGDHVVRGTEPLSVLLSKLGAANPPADQEVLSLIFIVGSVSSSTATTLLGSPVVASVVVAVVVVVVSKGSLPSLSQLTTVVIADRPPVWPPTVIIIPLTKDNAKDKNEDEDTEEDPHGDVSGLWQYNDPDTVCVMLSTRHPPLLETDVGR